MQPPNRQQRSYGFEQPEEETQDVSLKREKKAEQRQKHASFERKTLESPRPKQQTNRREKRKQERNTSFLSWSLLWKIPVGIITFLFGILAWLFGKKPKVSKKLKGFFWRLTFLAIAFGFIGGVIMVAWASKDLPDPDRLTDRQIAESTKIYDRTGEHILYEIFIDEKRTIIEFEDISPDVINGMIATEDTTFYEHKGIRPLSILRAVVMGIFTNRRIAGTSTLTQQLVKNAILTNERSIARKLKEAILSIRLEQKFTKEQILKIYFNEISYGGTNLGIESAAQSYFNTSANNLTLAQAAALAGMPKQPSTYLNNLEKFKERRDFVLRRMYEEGYITEEEKDAAQTEPLDISTNYGEIQAPHFSLYVREKLVEQFGENLVNTGGLHVITTLDWDKQQIAERIVDEIGTEALEAANADNTAMVAMDPNTSQILTMIGSKDFYDTDIDGQFNVATLGKRQPGSSFKPIIYTAAFEKGYTPETILYDVVTNFGAASGKDYTPLNYDLSEHGPITMRRALQGSLNIPAVKTLYLIGDKAGVTFAKRLGYSTFENGDFGLSLVLGGGEVHILEHVNAYTVLANGGTYREPVSILSVTDKDGENIYEWKAEKGEKVLDSEVTATISNVLSDDNARAYAFGTGSILTLPGRPVAAKTGTTNRYIDGWTIGYTPSLVAGVWAGNTDNTPMKPGYGGSKVAGPIWNAFMKEALADTPVEQFPPMPSINTTKPALRGTSEGGVTVQVNKVTGNLASSSTPENLIEKRVYVLPHSILHYVDKNDPQGDVPTNPEQDPQYPVWEAAIQEWVTKKQEEDPDFKLEFGEVPTTVDDESALELIPKLTVVFPTPSSTLTSRSIHTDIRVTAPRGVSKVTYKIDTAYVGVVREHPFNLDYTAYELESGDHVMTIIVEDDIGNTLEEQIPFRLITNAPEPTIVWRDNEKYTTANSESLLFLGSVYATSAIDEITLIARGEGSDTILYTGTNLETSDGNTFTLRTNNSLSPGNYQVFAEIKTTRGSTIHSSELSLILSE